MTTILIICALVYVASWTFLCAYYDVCDIPRNYVWAWVTLFTPMLNTAFAVIIILCTKSLSFRQFMWMLRL